MEEEPTGLVITWILCDKEQADNFEEGMHTENEVCY